MVLLGELNGKIGDGIKEIMNRSFGMPGDDIYGMRMVDFCAERNFVLQTLSSDTTTLTSNNGLAREDKVNARVGLI